MAVQQRKKKVATITLVTVNFANAKIDIKVSIKKNSSTKFFAVIWTAKKYLYNPSEIKRRRLRVISNRPFLME